MSKELVARALDRLANGSLELTTQCSSVYTSFRQVEDQTAALIRAVDEQYGDGYDDQEGFETLSVSGPRCLDCAGKQRDGHLPTCAIWNTRVALLALCRDILGENG